MYIIEWIKWLIQSIFSELLNRLFLFIVRNDSTYEGGWLKPIGYFSDPMPKSCACNKASQSRAGHTTS
jgi:hypothetical protein